MTEFTTWRSLVDGEEIRGIPDSAVAHIKIEEGSGTIAADNIGDADMQLSGPSWNQDSDFVEGWSLDFNDADEDTAQIETSDVVDVGDEGSLLVTIETRSDHEQRPVDWSDGDDDSRLQFELNTDNSVSIALGDETIGDVFTYSTGTKYRFALVWNDGDYEFYVNGEEEATGTYNGTVTTDTQWDFGYRAARDERYFDGFMDDIILLDKMEDSDVYQSDFNRQPWS